MNTTETSANQSVTGKHPGGDASFSSTDKVCSIVIHEILNHWQQDQQTILSV